MKTQKCGLSLLVILFLTAHFSWAGGGVTAVVRGVGKSAISKVAIPETVAGSVWKSGFSGGLVPVVAGNVGAAASEAVQFAAKIPTAAPTGLLGTQTAKLPASATAVNSAATAKLPQLKGEKIVDAVGNFFGFSREFYVGAYGVFNRDKTTGEISRAVVQKLPNLPASTPRIGDGYLFIEDSFKGIDLAGYAQADIPPYPLAVSKINVYRGMHLTANGIKDIFKDGLRLKANPNNAAKERIGTSEAQLLAFTPASSSLTASMDLAGVTYTTVSAQEALHYATLEIKEGEIPVVLKLSKKYRTAENAVRGGEHHLVKVDIPAEDIEEVAAVVQDANGSPMWCKIVPSPNGGLNLYPLISTQVAAEKSLSKQISDRLGKRFAE